MREPTSKADAINMGMTLGLYKANALLALPAAFVLAVLTPYWYLSIMFVVAAVLGVAGWKRDFDLQWNPYKTTEAPPNKTT